MFMARPKTMHNLEHCRKIMHDRRHWRFPSMVQASFCNKGYKAR
jgi:hypothetical protein